MAKIKHNDSFDTYSTIIKDAIDQGLFHLHDESDSFDGSKYVINHRDLLNFGYCGYLGLEMHPELKQGAIDLIHKYGVQYGVSRGYVTSRPEDELLDLLSQMYGGQKIIIQSSTSSSHVANLPNIIESNDAIILDQQVHFSVQTGAQLCRQKGVPIEMIRHNNLEMLKRKYVELKSTHRRIWYLVDGVYSMYGDTTPIAGLKEMLDELPQLFLYVDDAHGMSWRGETGGGYFFSKMGVHPKVILNTTMGKAFGVTGGITTYPTYELFERVRLFGGPLTYSHPLSPAIMGAGIASAKLHLSDRLAPFQMELQEKIRTCYNLISNTNIPLLSNPETPIFYIGLGQPKTVYNMVARVLKEGFYVNVGLFPGVAIKCSGIRFSISNHNKLEDIKDFVDCLAYHYPKALEEEGVSLEQVHKAFRLPFDKDRQVESLGLAQSNQSEELHVEYSNSIKNIGTQDWNTTVGAGSYDHKGLTFLEKAFSRNKLPRDNWLFHYFLIKDYKGQIVAATYLTETDVKDDIFAKESISRQIERRRREQDPEYLVSHTLMMGSLLTEGEQLYLKEDHPLKEEALDLLLNQIDNLQEKTGATNVILRDFNTDCHLSHHFFKNGFVKFDMPNSNVIEMAPWKNPDEFSKRLNSSKRRHFKKDILPYLDNFEVRTDEGMGPELLQYCYQLFSNVLKRNWAINIFPYPLKLLNEIYTDPNWEITNLYINDHPMPVSTIWSYKAADSYCPMLIGMDYQFLESHKLYKQSLFRSLERASQLGYNTIYMGLSADLEKRKLGAEQVSRIGFLRCNDNYALDVMESMSVSLASS